MSLYDETVPHFSQMLSNIDGWLTAAASHAAEQGTDPALLLTLQLAPDQFNLTRQVQSACDAAKLACARLSGSQAPVHPDGPATFAELAQRIADVRAFLDSVDRAAFDGVDDRKMTPPFLHGMAVSYRNYARQFAVPNFYFHACMVYALLRQSGSPLGKRAYIGHMTLEKPTS
ncbi:MAG: DUF1993 domain-containing protein [Myxococcales bacterium]|nr:DUF1993 domain-containing protein [Myxococcales bacterium]